MGKTVPVRVTAEGRDGLADYARLVAAQRGTNVTYGEALMDLLSQYGMLRPGALPAPASAATRSEAGGDGPSDELEDDGAWLDDPTI